MTTILLLGRQGQVGSELEPRLAALGNLIALGHAELDLADSAAIDAALARTRPQIVVNAAAYTNVDLAESQADLAMAVNCHAPATIARRLALSGGMLVHYSTDFVFDGSGKTPYREDDAPNPLNAYGASKLAGEQAVIASGVAHLILRTSWVYGDRGSNFVTTMRNLARTRRELQVVNDQTGSPTWARTIARVTCEMLARYLRDPASCQGIYHLASRGETTRFGLVEKLVELIGRDPSAAGFVRPALQAVDSSRFPTPARRPSYSVLDTRKLVNTLGITPPRWDDDLTAFMQATTDGTARPR